MQVVTKIRLRACDLPMTPLSLGESALANDGESALANDCARTR